MTIEKPRLVLLPGMDGTGLLFARFLEALGTDFEVQIVRYSTDVHSYEHVMDVLLSEIDQQRPHLLLAESFSSPAAISYAGLHPQQLLGVVLVAGFVSSPIRSTAVSNLVGMLSPLLMRLPIPSAFLRLLVSGEDSELESVKQAIGSVPKSTLAKRLCAVLNVDVQPQLQVPLLYLRAECDLLVTRSCARTLAERYPSTCIETIPGGHLLLQSSPRLAAERVTEFLGQSFLNGTKCA